MAQQFHVHARTCPQIQQQDSQQPKSGNNVSIHPQVMDTHSLAHTLVCHVAMTKREAASLAVTWMHLKHDAQCDSIFL